MNAFKFRSEAQLPFIIDIIENQRLYCPDLEEMNDPSEGMIQNIYWGRFKKPARKVAELMSLVRICSLSLTIHNNLLWSHYADGMRGAAIEVDLPDSAMEVANNLGTAPIVALMDYGSITTTKYERQSIDSIVFRKLTQKLTDWAYEEEVRVIALTDALEERQFYQLPASVKSVTVGTRMSSVAKKQIFDLCRSKSIPIYTAEHIGYFLNIHNVSEERALQGGIWQDEQGVSHFEHHIAFGNGPISAMEYKQDALKLDGEGDS